MMSELNYKYEIRSIIRSHSDDPALLGEKFVRTLNALTRTSSSIFANWELTNLAAKTSMPLTTALSSIGSLIENNVVRDDSGMPEPYHGYNAVAFTGEVAKSRHISLWVKAGGQSDGYAWLQTGYWKVPADPAIVTYSIFKAALLAINAIWPPPWACAYAFKSNYTMVTVHGGAGYKLESRPLLPEDPTFPESPFHIPWLAYLSTELATGLALPSPEILTERTPDGGLLMVATEDRLDPDNPEHRRRARILAEIMIARTNYQPGSTTRV
jgi:hypothetical protein